MRREYQIASKKDSRRLRQFLAQHGQALAPMVELIEQGRLAVEQLVHDLGRAALEAVLLVSAEQVAGPPHPGRAGGAIRRHGQQGGVVALGAQRVRAQKPRLRRRGGGEGAEVAEDVQIRLRREVRRVTEERDTLKKRCVSSPRNGGEILVLPETPGAVRARKQVPRVASLQERLLRLAPAARECAGEGKSGAAHPPPSGARSESPDLWPASGTRGVQVQGVQSSCIAKCRLLRGQIKVRQGAHRPQHVRCHYKSAAAEKTVQALE